MMPRQESPALAALKRKGVRDPDAAARIKMDADGQVYESEPLSSLDYMKGQFGFMGSPPPRRATRAGSMADAQYMTSMAKNGVELGGFYDEIADLNRGRRATGAAPEFDPSAGFAEAAQRAAPYANAAAQQTVQGNAGRMDSLAAGNDYSTSLASEGVDTEKAAYQMGPNWQQAKPAAIANYQWGEPPATALNRRPARRPQVR